MNKVYCVDCKHIMQLESGFFSVRPERWSGVMNPSIALCNVSMYLQESTHTYRDYRYLGCSYKNSDGLCKDFELYVKPVKVGWLLRLWRWFKWNA